MKIKPAVESRKDYPEWWLRFVDASNRVSQASELMLQAYEESDNEEFNELHDDIAAISRKCWDAFERYCKQVNGVKEGLFGGPRKSHVTDEYGFTVSDDEDDKEKKPSLLKKAWDKTGKKVWDGVGQYVDDFANGLGIYYEDGDEFEVSDGE